MVTHFTCLVPLKSAHSRWILSVICSFLCLFLFFLNQWVTFSPYSCWRHSSLKKRTNRKGSWTRHFAPVFPVVFKRAADSRETSGSVAGYNIIIVSRHYRWLALIAGQFLDAVFLRRKRFVKLSPVWGVILTIGKVHTHCDLRLESLLDVIFEIWNLSTDCVTNYSWSPLQSNLPLPLHSTPTSFLISSSLKRSVVWRKLIRPHRPPPTFPSTYGNIHWW